MICFTLFIREFSVCTSVPAAACYEGALPCIDLLFELLGS